MYPSSDLKRQTTKKFLSRNRNALHSTLVLLLPVFTRSRLAICHLILRYKWHKKKKWKILVLRYMLISWSTHRTIHLFSQVWDHSNCSPLGPPAPLYLCQYQREVNTLHTGPRLLPLCTMSRAAMWGIALLFKLLISFYIFKLLPQRCWNLAWDNKKIFFSS